MTTSVDSKRLLKDLRIPPQAVGDPSTFVISSKAEIHLWREPNSKTGDPSAVGFKDELPESLDMHKRKLNSRRPRRFHHRNQGLVMPAQRLLQLCD